MNRKCQSIKLLKKQNSYIFGLSSFLLNFIAVHSRQNNLARLQFIILYLHFKKTKLTLFFLSHSPQLNLDLTLSSLTQTLPKRSVQFISAQVSSLFNFSLAPIFFQNPILSSHRSESILNLRFSLAPFLQIWFNFASNWFHTIRMSLFLTLKMLPDISPVLF